jgi:hypothetical protein
MQIVFKKVEVLNLKADVKKTGLSIGDELFLQFDDARSCHAYFTPKQTWLGKNFINRRHQLLGDLSKDDALHLAKYAKDASKVRVRVVDATPKHISSENRDSVFISIWLK